MIGWHFSLKEETEMREETYVSIVCPVGHSSMERLLLFLDSLVYRVGQPLLFNKDVRLSSFTLTSLQLVPHKTRVGAEE